MSILVFQDTTSPHKRLAVKIMLFISLVIFLSAGLFHIAKFETTDEHFWKNGRITKYYKGLSDGIHKFVWKKTRINDKPGVTVALVSGLGLPFVWNDLKIYRDRETERSFDKVFTIYLTEKTEKINLSLRIPILLFNAIFLFFFFYIIQKITRNAWIAVTAVILIATSPVLIGISQIINPDALLWSFGAAAFFSYIALISTREKKFIILTSVLFGLALLSKYTANILFLFFLFFLFVSLIFSEKKINYARFLGKNYLHLFLITFFSWSFFAIFMPAVFQKPKHFLAGTILSPVLKPFLLPLGALIALLLCDLIFFRARVTELSISFFKKYRLFFLRIPATIMLLLVLLTLINAWTGTPFFSLENIKEVSYFEKELIFPQITSENPLVRTVLSMGIQSQNFIFSLPPFLLMIVCVGWLIMLFGKWRFHSDISATITLSPLVFFGGGLMSDIFINPRYAILLYPFFALFGALSVAVLVQFFLKHYNRFSENIIWSIICISILASGGVLLWQTKPFYLTYENFLLPRKYVVGDSWGYGSYEAAQFLNTLPQAKNLIIWSDRSAVCQFFVGKCIRDYKINLDEAVPNYFVFSRRGSLRHPFIWDTDSQTSPQHISEYYYEKMRKNPSWILMMNNRPQDFVAIVEVEE